MQFIIEQPNLRKYFCKNGQVIVFDSEQDAYQLAQNFYNYATMQAMSFVFSDPGIMQTVVESSQKWKVIPLPENFEAKTINYNTIKK